MLDTNTMIIKTMYYSVHMNILQLYFIVLLLTNVEWDDN